MKECVIAGTGPSLDTADWSTLPETRIAVNFSAYVVPDLSYVAVLDHKVIRDHLSMIKGWVSTVHTVDVCVDHEVTMPDRCHFIDYCKYSAHAAVKHAIKIGAEHIVFIGMDGGMGRAPSIAQYYNDSDRTAANNSVHHFLIEAEMLDAGVTWVGLGWVE